MFPWQFLVETGVFAGTATLAARSAPSRTLGWSESSLTAGFCKCWGWLWFRNSTRICVCVCDQLILNKLIILNKLKNGLMDLTLHKKTGTFCLLLSPEWGGGLHPVKLIMSWISTFWWVEEGRCRRLGGRGGVG